ncbi:MAG TPA: MBL fold metallo-hydrolase [Candidatus Nanopelagicaceae bacterium]|nr:MBL fold metallo-hydrolase [Candidatus Nanopelagicaceae bacterium]
MRVDIIETPDLGDRSYVISDGTCAIVIDPQRDIDRVADLLTKLGVQVTLVLETHIHNDYVTGGFALAQHFGATYVVSGRDEVEFARTPAQDGDVFQAGSMTVEVLETPGHTDTHLSYVISDGSAEAPAVFTGGSLLYGSVGRTDLLGTDRTDELTRKQWRSARRLAAVLPDNSPLYPTHGFGSFCSSGGATGAAASTIGAEKHQNDALQENDEQTFVDRLIAGLTAYPAYYSHMATLNVHGPEAPDLNLTRSVEPMELTERIRAGEWVVDLRDRAAYADQHLSGTVSIMFGDQFSTYLGWIIPWGVPITLIGESVEQIRQAQRQLVRIGIDRLAGAAAGKLKSLAEAVPMSSYPRVKFPDLAASPDASVLDVRRADEYAQSRIEGASNIPIHDLLDRLAEVPSGEIWIHCGAGFRASIAASILARAGHKVVHIDDDFENAEKAGLTIVR